MNIIIEMAKQAGPLITTPFDQWCENFAALVRAQTLEEVEQKVPCGKHTDKWGFCRIADYNRGWNDYRKQCAAAIRALKEMT